MKIWLSTAAIALALLAWVVFRPDRALQVASGLTAQMLCSAAFVSGVPAETTFTETVRPMMGTTAALVRYDVDEGQKSIRASVLGAFSSKAAYHKGYGCRLEYPDSIAVPPPLPEDVPAAEPPLVETDNADLRAALDRAFAEEAGQPPRNVKALLIMKDGRIVAERYAAGYGPETPLLSYSVAKSVTGALIGILVRQGKLNIDAPASIAAWHGANDPRSAITLDNLLRMTSGLDMHEDGSGFDAASQMVYAENDMARFAQGGQPGARPGTVWSYTSTNTVILSSVIRDAVGGGQQGFVRFARDALFAPIGMHRVTMEFDGVGTQEGSASILAPARDWARFGQLFLNDGMAPNGTRVLPEGWVAYSKRSTLGSIYGAGFWTNDGGSEIAAALIQQGMPRDSFFASGNLGQRIYIVPSERLVMVRFGVTHRPPTFDIAGDMRLMRTAIAALK